MMHVRADDNGEPGERRTALVLYGNGIEISDAAARVLAGAAPGFFDEALEICGRLPDLPGLASELKRRLGSVELASPLDRAATDPRALRQRAGL